MITAANVKAAEGILRLEKSVRDTRGTYYTTISTKVTTIKNETIPMVGGYELPIDIVDTMARQRRGELEYQLAKDIYAQPNGPKDFAEVMVAAKKEMKQLFDDVIKANPKLAPLEKGSVRR